MERMALQESQYILTIVMDGYKKYRRNMGGGPSLLGKWGKALERGSFG